LIITIVGGSFFSTSSGIRLVKLYSLFKFSINELGSHAKPLNVFINKLEFSDTKIETKDIVNERRELIASNKKMKAYAIFEIN